MQSYVFSVVELVLIVFSIRNEVSFWYLNL